MKKLFVFVLFFVSLFAFSSEVRVFNDKVVYVPNKPSSFIGFNSAVKVVCDNKVLPLKRGIKPPETFSLYKVYVDYLDTLNKISVLEKQKLLYDKAFENFQFKNSNDFSIFFKNAGTYASKYAKIENEIERLKVKFDNLKDILSPATQDKFPFYCDLPKNAKSFKLIFKGIYMNIKNKLFLTDNNNGYVIKELAIKNASGIDIKANKFYILNRYAMQYFNVIEFYPWQIREGVKNMRYAPVAKSKPAAARIAQLPVEKQSSMPTQLASRLYYLENVNLPSDGIEKKFDVKKEKVKINKRLVVYPYTNTSVFNEYSFKLPFEIDGNFWEVFAGKETYSNVRGRFDKDNNVYRVFAGIDYSLEVERKKIVNFGKETGFFSKTKVLKDGYKITIRNLGDKAKHLYVIDRVPVSTNEDIKVKDVVVEGVKDYKIGKKGKLVAQVNLEPKQVVKIKVVFTIEHPKDVEITY